MVDRNGGGSHLTMNIQFKHEKLAYSVKAVQSDKHGHLRMLEGRWHLPACYQFHVVWQICEVVEVKCLKGVILIMWSKAF